MDEGGAAIERPARRPASRRHRRWVVPLVLALALSVVVVVALVEALHQSTPPVRAAMTQTPAGFYKPSRTMPVAFSLPVLQAAASSPAGTGQVTMASLRGEPVVLNMWSSSCTVCKSETPAMESVARRVRGAVKFVGVDTLDQRGAGLGFLHRYQVSYLQLFDPAEHVGSGYGIPGLPVTVFVSAHGKVVGEYLGALSTKSLAHYLATLFGVRLAST